MHAGHLDSMKRDPYLLLCWRASAFSRVLCSLKRPFTGPARFELKGSNAVLKILERFLDARLPT